MLSSCSGQKYVCSICCNRSSTVIKNKKKSKLEKFHGVCVCGGEIKHKNPTYHENTLKCKHVKLSTFVPLKSYSIRHIEIKKKKNILCVTQGWRDKEKYPFWFDLLLAASIRAAALIYLNLSHTQRILWMGHHYHTHVFGVTCGDFHWI